MEVVFVIPDLQEKTVHFHGIFCATVTANPRIMQRVFATLGSMATDASTVVLPLAIIAEIPIQPIGHSANNRVIHTFLD
jgi:hypothetical protein